MIICLIIGVLLNNYFDTYNLKLLLVLIIGYTLIYTILTYLMSMNDYEKCMVKSIFNKLKRFKYQRV